MIDDSAEMTTGQPKARIARLCIEAGPADAQLRYSEAATERRVVSEATESGTANLFRLDLPPHRVAAVMCRINHLARNLNTASETRTMDQLRSDVLLDLLDGTGTVGTQTGQGLVDIRVDLDTLVYLNEMPGELAGYGPVIADIVRQVTVEQLGAEWRFMLTDSSNGQALHTGTTRRRPTTAQRRQVEARTPTCVFPGCRMPATNCDFDHRIPWAEGGPTTVDHLAPLCRDDHTIRHHAGWTYRLLPNGKYEWTTRLCHTYTTSGAPP